MEILKAQIVAIQSAPPVEPTIPRAVEERFERLEKDVQSLQSSIKPLVDTAMEEGFYRIESMIGEKLEQLVNTMGQPPHLRNSARPNTSDSTKSPKRPLNVSPPSSGNISAKYSKTSEPTASPFKK
jgi:hypothetical protein